MECPYCHCQDGYTIIGKVSEAHCEDGECEEKEVEVEKTKTTKEVVEGLFDKKPSHALIAKLDEPDNGYEWYSLAVSSDVSKLKEREADIKSKESLN